MKKHFIIILICIISAACSTNKEKKTISSVEKEKADSIYMREQAHKSYLRFYKYEEITSLDSLLATINSAKTVKAYNWNSKDTNSANMYYYIVDAYGVFDDRINLEITLNNEEINELKNIICNTNNYDTTDVLGAASFYPHIAFVYYDQNDSIIGQSNYSYMHIGVFKNVPKTNSYIMTKEGKAKMREFCTEIGLEFLEGSE